MSGNESITITRSMRRAIVGLLTLVLIVGGGNLWATFQVNHSTQQAEQQQSAAARRQGQLVERRLCTTLGRLTVLRPPPGNPATNPSRAFDQKLHDTLSQLSPDLGCGKARL